MNPAITYPFRVVNIDYLLLEFYMLCFAVFFLELPRHPKSTLFPYTTLFRSQIDASPLPIRRNPFDRGQTPPLHSGKVQRSRSEEHTSELQSRFDLVCRLLLEKKNFAHHLYPFLKKAVKEVPSANYVEDFLLI